jgi:hypothetical protein
MVIGALTGLFLFATSTIINRLLGIDEESDRLKVEQKKRQQSTRSVAEYRAERRRKKHTKLASPADHPHSISPRNGSSFGSLSGLSETNDNFGAAWAAARGQPLQLAEQTILEEEDSSSPFE